MKRRYIITGVNGADSLPNVYESGEIVSRVIFADTITEAIEVFWIETGISKTNVINAYQC